MRLFVAILFTPEINAELTYAIEKLRSIAPQGDFTIPDNLHMTLAFIGEAKPNRVDDIMSAIEEARPMPFQISLSGLGKFDRKGGDIVWAGIKDNKPLAEYAGRLADALRKKGFDIETREYKPHITLGRRVVLTGKLDINIKNLSMRCNRISLMKSERIAGELTYTEIRSVKV